MSGVSRWRLVPLVALFGAALLLWVAVPLDVRLAQAWLGSAGLAAPVLYLGCYVVGALLFVPRPLLTMTGGLLFGAVLGTALAVVGATVAALACFLVSRTTGVDVLGRASPRGVPARIDAMLRRRGWLAVAYLRLLPVLPFSLVSYCCGLTKVRAGQFAAGTALGGLPATVLLAMAGRGLADPSSAAVIVPLVVAVLFALAGVAVARATARTRTGLRPSSTMAEGR